MISKPTFTDTLPSGVEFEVAAMSGAQQRIITSRLKGQRHEDRLNEMLASVLMRVGSETNISKEFVQNMLTPDKRAALVASRQFSMDFEKEFIYPFTYDDAITKATKTAEIPIELQDDGTFPIRRMAKQYKDYKEIDRTRQVILPKSGLTVEYRLCDGDSEKFVSLKKAEEVSAHTLIQMRFARIANGDGTYDKLDLDELALKDIEAIRTSIKAEEGAIDTEIKFEHPDAENLDPKDRFVIVDLLSTTVFFFPSGAI